MMGLRYTSPAARAVLVGSFKGEGGDSGCWALYLSHVWNFAQTSVARPCGRGSRSGSRAGSFLNNCGQQPQEGPLSSF